MRKFNATKFKCTNGVSLEPNSFAIDPDTRRKQREVEKKKCTDFAKRTKEAFDRRRELVVRTVNYNAEIAKINTALTALKQMVADCKRRGLIDKSICDHLEQQVRGHTIRNEDDENKIFSGMSILSSLFYPPMWILRGSFVDHPIITVLNFGYLLNFHSELIGHGEYRKVKEYKHVVSLALMTMRLERVQKSKHNITARVSEKEAKKQKEKKQKEMEKKQEKMKGVRRKRPAGKGEATKTLEQLKAATKNAKNKKKGKGKKSDNKDVDGDSTMSTAKSPKKSRKRRTVKDPVSDIDATKPT